MSFRLPAGALLVLSVSTPAFAQSFTAPAGIPAVTAPGGIEGRAALSNLAHARNVGTYGRAFGDPAATTVSVRRSHGTRPDDLR